MGLPVPAFAAVSAPSDVSAFGAAQGWPVVLKAIRGGYDGRGVWFLPGPDDALVADLLERGTPLMVETAVPMTRELAASVARSPFRQAAAWPVVETLQVDGECARVTAPAPGLSPDAAGRVQELALRIAEELGVVGLMTVELFETTAGEVVVNELCLLYTSPSPRDS